MGQTTLNVLVSPGQWKGIGLVAGAVAPGPQQFSDTNPPWRLRAGESIMDNRPAGLTEVFAGDLTNSRDLGTIFSAAGSLSVPAGPVIIRFDTGQYIWNRLINYGTPTNPDWRGYSNGNRKVLGWAGAGMDSITGEPLTTWTESPTMINDSPDGARAFVLADVSTSDPAPLCTLYISGSGAAAPLFMTGISYDGQFQGPYGVYATTKHATRNRGNPAPIVHKGIVIWRGNAGSRFQYSRARGYGYASLSAPPFEAPFMDTNYNRMVTFATEIDGRVASWVDVDRPRSSGGILYNKEVDSELRRVWMHHTRRSGAGNNTNTQLTTEKYTFTDFQTDEIANVGDDGWPADNTTLPGGFNSINDEGIVGKLKAVDSRLTVVQGKHVAIAIPFSGSNGTYVLPGQVIVEMQGCTTKNTEYNGCMQIGTSQTPNSTGTSPLWTALIADFAGTCATYFDIKNAAGTPLTPVKGSLFNYTTMGPSTHYVLASM